MINKDRLADTFKFLVEIDSVSGEEREISQEIQKIWGSLGAETFTDGAGEKIDGNAGNLIAWFPGNKVVEPMLLNAHMDTVEPGRGIRPQFENGIFTSRGDTILGADDKSAVAVLIEVMRVLKEEGTDHGPLEIVLTVAEEVGLKGAKNLDFSRIRSRFGYALDSSDTEGIVVRAPGANRIEFRIHGKDAHAGAAPEKGINAIMLAAEALTGLEIGRIDRETTCNIGVIEGGKAINIVPSLVIVKGEARSHDRAKLDRTTETMIAAFEKAVGDYRDQHKGDFSENEGPRLEVVVENDFLSTHIPEDHRVVQLAARAAGNLGRGMRAKPTGGGADANVFFQKGIFVGVLGTGMRDMHTVRESVALEDMVKAAALLLEIIRLHGEG
jgi:tripeptide aminopeptidase